MTCASMMHVAGWQLLSFQIVCIAGNEAEKLAMRGLLVASITIQSGHVTDIIAEANKCATCIVKIEGLS